MFVAIRGKGKHSQFRAIYEAFMRENMISNLQVSTYAEIWSKDVLKP